MPQPVRTCVGCRGQAAKAELLRIVWTDGGARADPRQTEPGRGAYLHRSEDCLRRAVKRRALGRALRLQGRVVDPAALQRAVEPQLARSPESPAADFALSGERA